MKVQFPVRFPVPLSSLLFLSVFSFLLSGCQDHKDTSAETFGQIDSLQIAADTTMQANMDRSYEFQKTLIEDDTCVYDFLAYDKPKGSSSPDWESKFIVIRRTGHTSDTIIKDSRSGIVRNIWLSDMDRNGRSEIMFYEYPKANAQSSNYFDFYAYQTDGRKKAKKIEAKFGTNDPHYRGRDSFLTSGEFLLRKYPYYALQSDTISSGAVWQSYKLLKGTLVIDREKKVLQ